MWNTAPRPRDSVVGIVTHYGLDSLGFELRWGEIFLPVNTGPGTQTTSCAMSTGSLFCGRRGRGMVLTAHPHLVLRLREGRSMPLLSLWTYMTFIGRTLPYHWLLFFIHYLCVFLAVFVKMVVYKLLYYYIIIIFIIRISKGCRYS
jgi:hypothetical protein